MSIPPNIISKPDPDTVVVALGANLPSPAGPPEVTINAAIDALAELAAGPVQSSTLQITQPVGCPAGSPPFVNAVALFRAAPGLNAPAMLRALLALEARFGRRRSGEINAARSLDLDLISFGREQRHSPQLTLPHPRAHERQFVLAPLAEIAPRLRLPGWTVSIDEQLAVLEAS